MKNKESNCPVLQQGDNAEDHAHVKKVTPFDTKRAEIYNDPQYRTQFENGIDPKREAATTRARRDGKTRPLGGGAARKG
jgi:hypothetical protein